MARLKIFAMLSKEARLEPVSGDRINEMNMLRAMSLRHDVFYNGVKIAGQDQAFGRSDGTIEVPKKGQYDLVYVRNNRDLFLAAPSPKVWFASPYDAECFAQADGIVAMTGPWKERLARYSSADFDYFDRMYPLDMAAPKSVLLFPQAIELPSWQDIVEARTGSAPTTPKSWRDGWGILPGRNSAGKRIIRHFGPVRPSNYPIHLEHYLREHPDLLRRMTAECVGAGKRVDLPVTIVRAPRVAADKVQGLLFNSDAVWYSQHHSGNIAGSLKVLEAMASGVPILLPKWDARVEELGEDYPYFWSIRPGSSYSDPDQPDFLHKLEQVLGINQNRRAELGRHLHERAAAHSIANVANILDGELARFHDER